MERPGHENCPCMETCPLNRALGLIGGKWKMQILCALSNNGPTRYNRLKKTLDRVSNTVLANALRELEEDGLVLRGSIWRCRCGWNTAPRTAAGHCCPFWSSSATGQRPGCELSIGQIPEFVCKIHHFSQIAVGIIEQIAGFSYQCPLQSCHNPV